MGFRYSKSKTRDYYISLLPVGEIEQDNYANRGLLAISLLNRNHITISSKIDDCGRKSDARNICFSQILAFPKY